MADSSSLVFIYTTLPDLHTADGIAEKLVETRLAACVNIYPGMRSVYRWEGRTARDEEVGVFVKTRTELAERTKAELARLHPYEVPALLVLPIQDVTADYLSWALAQTRP